MSSRKIGMLVAVVGICSFIISCTATINSRVRPGYVAQTNRMLILLVPHSGSRMFLGGLAKSLSEKLLKYGVSTSVHEFDDMNPDEKSVIREKMQTFNPGLILQIEQTTKQTLNGAPSGGLFELVMYEPGDSAYVWKANLQTYTSGYGGTGIPSQAAENIMQRFLADRIFGGGNSSPDL